METYENMEELRMLQHEKERYNIRVGDEQNRQQCPVVSIFNVVDEKEKNVEKSRVCHVEATS